MIWPSDRLVFVGDISDEALAALYQRAISLVFPSLYEGFGYPPAEALACGASCITSGNSSLPEAVGEHGILVDPQNPQKIANAMQDLLENPRNQSQENAQAIAWASQFSWQSAAEAHMRLYKELVNS